VIRSLVRSALVLLAASATTTALLAQSFTLPAATPGTPVQCTGCLSDVQPLSPGYQLPIKTFTGRYVDSTWTPDYQCGFRTARSGGINFSPDGKRVYIQMGSGVVAYSTDTFFTQKLGQPLASINNLASALGLSTVRFCGRFAETYLPWDKFSYFEGRGSGFDVSNAMDGQDRLTGYDVDDRGNVYSAAFIYGWGIAHDNGAADGQLMTFVSQKTLANNQGMAADSIFAVKADGRYYAVTGAQRASQAIVWDVTDATNPVFVGIRNIPLPDSIAHNAAGDRLAMVAAGELRIYTASGYIDGASPIFRATPAAGRSFGLGVASDGSNFYAAETGTGLPIRFHTLAPQGSTAVSDTTADTTELFNSLHLDYNSGLLTLSGSSPAGGSDIRVFRVVSPTNFRNIDLHNYVRDFYFHIPGVSAFSSATSQGTKILLADATTYKHANGKTYLFVSAYGLGDVYELETADAISASVKRFGETPNPNAPTTSATAPVYGDKVVFSGTATAATPFPVTWSFGNPETADNGNLSILSNLDVTHQFGGLTAAGIAGPKQVTVTSLQDPTVTGTLPLQLRMPIARIGVQSAGLPLAILGAQPPAALVTGDSFVDASDGAVEGHFSSWSLDGVVTQAIPSVPTSVGACGARVMSMTAHYGPYVSTGTVLSTVPGSQGPVDFPLTVGPISYNAVPFLPSVGSAASSADGTSVVFTGAVRVTSDPAAFVGAPSFTYHWDLMNAGKTASIASTTPAAVGPGGTVAPFVVPNATVAANPGSSAQLSVSIASAGLSAACAQFASAATVGSALNPPDPKVVPTGCTATNIPCSLTATSIGGNESDWLPAGYTWTIDNTIQAAHTKTISPTLSDTPVGFPHSITVTVTNSFTKATSAPLLVNTSRPLCSGVPTSTNISVVFTGATSHCGTGSSASCTAGEAITFISQSLIYPFNAACDKFTWNWDDGKGFVADVRNPVHAFDGSKNLYDVKMNIDGGSGSPSMTYDVFVSFGGSTQPPPTCTVPTAQGLAITNRGLTSGCAPRGTCSSGETINFDVVSQLVAFDFSCGNPRFAWDFGDNGATSPAKTVNHIFQTAGTYNVTVQVSNDSGSATLRLSVVVADNGGPSTCGTNPNAINTVVRYSQTPTGCTELNKQNCSASSPVIFDLEAVQYSLASCYTILWHFDDGSPDVTQQSPTHTFIGGKSSYAVTVTISGGPGGPVPFHANLSFGTSPALPEPAFTATPAPTSPERFVFTASNAPDGVTLIWDFGDGQQTTPTTDKSVTHTYSAAGTYVVVLTFKDSSGATSTHGQTVTFDSRHRGAHH
jgi:PKD repeat protein